MSTSFSWKMSRSCRSWELSAINIRLASLNEIKVRLTGNLGLLLTLLVSKLLRALVELDVFGSGWCLCLRLVAESETSATCNCDTTGETRALRH